MTKTKFDDGETIFITVLETVLVLTKNGSKLRKIIKKKTKPLTQIT